MKNPNLQISPSDTRGQDAPQVPYTRVNSILAKTPLPEHPNGPARLLQETPGYKNSLQSGSVVQIAPDGVGNIRDVGQRIDTTLVDGALPNSAFMVEDYNNGPSKKVESDVEPYNTFDYENPEARGLAKTIQGNPTGNTTLAQQAQVSRFF